MASKVIATDVVGAVVVVTVRHLDSDSFTRSVDRAANRAWRSLPLDVRRRTLHVRASYAHACEGRECLSTVAYGPSFAEAAQALPASAGIRFVPLPPDAASAAPPQG